LRNIQFKTNDVSLDADVFINMANEVWAGTYNVQFTKEALERTMPKCLNITSKNHIGAHIMGGGLT